MPLIFNSVQTYVETIGRRREINRLNTLDAMECIFTGPSETVDQWIPKTGSPHQTYSNMFCDRATPVWQAADMTELRVAYLGKFNDMGAPSVGSSTHQGEISWTSYDSLNVFISTLGVQAGGKSGTETDSGGHLIPAVDPIYSAEFVSYTWLARFIITTAIYKTITRNPSQSIGGGGGSVRVTSQFRTARVTTPSGAGMIVAVLTFPTVLIDSSVNPLNNGWFEVTSTWGPQPQIVTTLQNLTTPIFS